MTVSIVTASARAAIHEAVQKLLDRFFACAPRKDFHSKSDSSAALPPAAAVFTVTVCSVANRAR